MTTTPTPAVPRRSVRADRTRAFDRTPGGMADSYEVYRLLRHLAGLRSSRIARLAKMPVNEQQAIRAEAENVVNAIRADERRRVLAEVRETVDRLADTYNPGLQ